MFRFFLFLMFFWCCQGAKAQQFSISEPFATRNYLGYDILGRVGENYLLFRDKTGDYDVMAFNAGMVNTWTRELDIPARNTKIISIAAGQNDFSIYYKTRLKGSGDYVLGLRKFDPGAQLIDSMTIMNYGSAYENQPILEHVQSENGQITALINSKHEDRLDIICFHTEQMKLLYQKSWFFDPEVMNRKIPGFVLGNDGTLYIITDENSRKPKQEDHKLKIVQIKNNSDDLFVVPLGSWLTSDIAYKIDNRNQRLIAAGLWSEKNPERIQGHFTVFFDLKTRTHIVNQVPFDDQTVSVMSGRDATDASKGVLHLQVRNIMARNDGGAILCCERQHFVERGMTTGRSGFFRDAPRRVVDYFYDEVVVINTNPDGKTFWRTILHKKQYSQDDDGIYSSYFPMLEPDRMRLIFNDEILNESTCSAYSISPLGTYSRESLLNTEGRRLRLRMSAASQISSNELVIPSEFNGKMQLMRIEF